MTKLYGQHVRRLRRLLGRKQEHLAEVMQVAQTTISRWESGKLHMSSEQYDAALEALGAHGAGADRAIRRLVEGASQRVHLICDRTHRLLAASPARCAEWQQPLDQYLGRSLLRFASPEILAAGAGLRDLGWYERLSATTYVETGANESADVPIVPGRVLWERLWLADGSAVRLVTTLPLEGSHA